MLFLLSLSDTAFIWHCSNTENLSINKTNATRNAFNTVKLFVIFSFTKTGQAQEKKLNFRVANMKLITLVEQLQSKNESILTRAP